MAEIQLSILQRLSLDNILGEQRGSVKDLVEVYDIAKKIKLEDRSEYIKVLPSGGAIFDEKKAREAGPISVDLEKAERRKLKEILDGYKNFSPGDMEWVLPLQTQLDTIKE